MWLGNEAVKVIMDVPVDDSSIFCLLYYFNSLIPKPHERREKHPGNEASDGINSEYSDCIVKKRYLFFCGILVCSAGGKRDQRTKRDDGNERVKGMLVLVLLV